MILEKDFLIQENFLENMNNYNRNFNSNFGGGGGGGAGNYGENSNSSRRINGSMRRKMAKRKAVMEGQYTFIRPSKNFSKFTKKKKGEKAKNFNSFYKGPFSPLDQLNRRVENLSNLSSAITSMFSSSELDQSYLNPSGSNDAYSSPLEQLYNEAMNQQESDHSRFFPNPYSDRDMKNEPFEGGNYFQGEEGQEDYGEDFKPDEPLTKIKVAIIDGSPENELTQKHYEMLQACLLDAIDRVPFQSPPQFVKSFIAKGMFYVVCANEATVYWLAETIKRNRRLWDGADLKLSFEIPGKKKVLVRVPSFEHYSRILKRLAIQNPGLETHSWTIAHRTQNRKVQTLFLLVDDESYEMLLSNNMTMYYGLGKVSFKTKDMKNKNTKKSENDPAEKTESPEDAKCVKEEAK